MQTVKKIVDAQLKEALISMTTLGYIEEHQLLMDSQLEDAKKSLQALFLRTSGEETMLRKLILILKTTKTINKAFTDVSKILAGISRSAETLEKKLAALAGQFNRLRITAEENSDFIGPFMVFSREFLNRIRVLRGAMERYIDVKENEARYANVRRIAQEARHRLKDRLSGALGAQARSQVEARIRKDVVQTFDYGEAEKKLKSAKRKSRMMSEEVNEILADLKEMCQMVMNPDMREKTQDHTNLNGATYDDMYSICRAGFKAHLRLGKTKQGMIELFKLYQHSYGMFKLDFEHLNRAIAPMMSNADIYFQSKEEDQDISSKREKLQKIEVLIPFVERTAEALPEKDARKYAKFSRRFSEIISEENRPWSYIGGDLLRFKVMAEAELSARM
ncbi:MAG: hypothetical protein IH808_10650 [Proteobacteria bacterium]|nr:hypothetical protein [Pseudomonadota bacterium]